MKTHLTRWILACTVALLAPTGLRAQPDAFTFDHMTAREGLPDIMGGYAGRIHSVVQDSAGFIWISGFGGLARYDGYDFTVYRHDPEDSTSLSDDRTTSLYVDRAGRLWVGTEDGLNRFDETTGRFRRYLSGEADRALGLDRVSSAYEDTRGTFWVGTGGFLLRLNRETGAYTRFLDDPDNPDKPQSDYDVRIYEDRSGTLWVAKRQAPYGAPGVMDPRQGSLNRYDPATETFISYTLDPANANGLADGRVGPLLEDRNGTFWVGTWGDGLHTMDQAAGTFTHHPYDPAHPGRLSAPHLSTGAPAVSWWLGMTVLHEDRRGLLWLGARGGGLNVYDLSSGRLTHFEYDPENPDGPASNDIARLYESRDGTLWLTYRRMAVVTRIYPTRRRFVHHIPAGDHPNSLGTGVNGFHENEEGTLWAISNAGLDRLDPATGALTHVPHDPARPGPLGLVHYNPDGTTWIGRWRGELERLDRATGRTTIYRHDPADPNSLSKWVNTVYEDREGSVWVGTWGQGLNRLDPATGTFVRYGAPPSRDLHGLVRAMDRYDTEGRSLAALLRMGSSVDTSAAFELTVPTPVLIAAQGEVRPQFGDGDGGWIEDDDEAVVWEPAFEEMLMSGGVWRFKFHIAADTLGPGRYRARYRSDSGEDVENNWSGLRVDYPDRWGIQVYALPEGENPLYPSPEATPPARTVSGLNIGALMEDRSGTLWVGTDFGVDRYDRASDTFVHYPFPRTRMTCVTALYEDRRGRYWVGTYGDGLYRLDASTGIAKKVDLGNKFESHDWIRSVIEDDAGYLWIAAEGALTRLDPETEAVRRFSQADGVPMRNYYGHSAFKGSDGTLYFGGSGGFTSFRPELMFNTEPPEVALTRLWLFNDEVTPSAEGPLREPLRQAQGLTLRHNQNVVTIDYAGLLFNDLAGVTYEYQLEGYDTEPVRARRQRSARYANLDPRSYTFRVRAANADGLWGEEASLAITVLPPWWRRWWAYTLYSVLFVVAVVGGYRGQHARIVQREQEKARERELEQARQIEQAYHELEQTHQHLKTTQQQLVHAEKMASLGALTAGIAHEIKNPLNFITGFAEVNIEMADELHQAWHNGDDDVEDLLNDLKRNARMIDQHGKRADAIVQSMMQHASGGTGEREATDLNILVGEYVDLAYHGKRAQTPGFNVTLEQDLDAAVGRVEMVPQEIGRVLLNLLANAFDAVHGKTDAETGGRGDGETGYAPIVQVSTRRTGDRIEIRVSDNGPGIPSEIKEKIFEPFYTTKPTGSGTGLGLSLAYDIVTQGHGGTLAVESSEGEGATFVLTLPG